jgi:hypothetical protein
VTQLIEALPSWTGPYLTWAAGNFDVVRPLLICVALTVLAIEATVWVAMEAK